jgi:hypothetical protein
VSKLVRRYRKRTMERALKQLDPIFTLTPSDVMTRLVEGRL